MKYLRLILFFVLGVWLIPATALAQFTETKELQKQFKVSPETRIEISNKYGKIELNTWEKDSVVVEIKIKVEEKKLSKLEKAIDAIDFDFTQSQHFLVARTNVGQNKSGFEKEILKFKETVFQSDGNMTIDYTVWLPATNDLKVENKFGDIFIGNYEGEVEINLSNGNLKSNDFTGKLELILSFADATINTIESGNLDCNFSEVYIKKATSLRIKSKSTKFEILEIKELDANSRRDNFKIRLADMVEASGSFSNFRINELTDRLNLRADYGDLDIEKTAVDFSNIFIESKSTDINLYFDEQSEFGFEITHTKTDLDFCREIKIEREESLDEKEKRIKLIGIYGDKTDGKSKLNIKASSGEINIFSN
jgi:hypothetical protein